MPRVATHRCRSVLAALLVLVGTAAAAASQDLDVVNAVVIDGTGATPRLGTTLRIRGGRIAAIDAGAPPSTPAGVTRIDLAGRTVLPGLIDAHAHIASPDAARLALESGVTTARVLGDTFLQALGTRDLIRAGHVIGPELLVSSSIIRPRPGVAFYQAYPEFGRFVSVDLRGPETIASVVKAQIARGVDVIKVGASERAGLAATWRPA